MLALKRCWTLILIFMGEQDIHVDMISCQRDRIWTYTTRKSFEKGLICYHLSETF